MGDEVLKTFIFIPLFLLGLSCAVNADSYDEQIKKYDEIFTAINQKRLGLEDKDIEGTTSPFVSNQISSEISTDSNETYDDSDSNSLSLKAIFGDRVKIGRSWFKEGDTVGSYILKKINKNSAILANENETIDLNLTQGNANVIIAIH